MVVELPLARVVRPARAEPPSRRRPRRRVTPQSALAPRSGREYLDFIVGGNSLGDRFGDLVRTPGGSEDRVSVFSLDWPDELVAAQQMLLGTAPSTLPDGRVPLYVCAECGDLGCGAVTAVVDHGAQTVTWRDFGHQTDYEPYEADPTLGDVGPLAFDAAAYLDVLTRASRPSTPTETLGGR